MLNVQKSVNKNLAPKNYHIQIVIRNLFEDKCLNMSLLNIERLKHFFVYSHELDACGKDWPILKLFALKLSAGTGPVSWHVLFVDTFYIQYLPTYTYLAISGSVF